MRSNVHYRQLVTQNPSLRGGIIETEKKRSGAKSAPRSKKALPGANKRRSREHLSRALLWSTISHTRIIHWLWSSSCQSPTAINTTANITVPPPSLLLYQRCTMEGRARSDQAIIDHFSQHLMVRRPRRGGTLEEEDDDDYQSRRDTPPEYIIAAITR